MNLHKDNEIKQFDLVELAKIDSPVMLVLNITEEHTATVGWFDSTKRFNTFTFDDTTLEKVKTIPIVSSLNKLLSTDILLSEYITSGKKILAIKHIRKKLNIGLKEAKDMVDKISNRYGDDSSIGQST